MANTATSNYNTNEGIYEVKVNGTVVAGRSNSSEATTIKDRLNYSIICKWTICYLLPFGKKKSGA